MSDSTASNSAVTPSPGMRVRRRKAGTGSSASAPVPASARPSGMMRMYTEDSPGLKVDPLVVLVFSLVFIASVFALHIYGKVTRVMTTK